MGPRTYPTGLRRPILNLVWTRIMPIELNRKFFSVRKNDIGKDPSDLIGISQSLQESKSWADVLGFPVSVVLAEAGSGKTSEFWLQSALEINGTCLLKEIGEISEHTEFSKALAGQEHSKIKSWKTETCNLTLFLDAVEEARLTKNSLQTCLASIKAYFDGYMDRIRFVVSSRVTDWNDVFHSQLSGVNLGQQTEVKYFQMKPLDEPQIRILATHFGINKVDGFVDELKKKNAILIASRPFDVKLLCSKFKQVGEIGSISDAYEFLLSSKFTAKRKNITENDVVSRSQYIAGITILCGTYKLHWSPDEYAQPNDKSQIGLRKLLTDLNDDQIEEVSRLPIFDLATFDTLRFNHRSLQDFLAARWIRSLVEAGTLSSVQIQRILFVKKSNALVVPLHLRPLAAWISLFDKRICELLCESDPETLLNYGDPEGLETEMKERIILGLVEKYKDRSFVNLSFDKTIVGRFSFTDVNSILKKLLSDNSMSAGAQRSLIAISSDGKFTDLASNILPIAKDHTSRNQVQAVFAINELGNDDQIESLVRSVTRNSYLAIDLSGALLQCFFPLEVPINDLIKILEKTEYAASNSVTLLDVCFEKKFFETLSKDEAIDLIEKLYGLSKSRRNDGLLTQKRLTKFVIKSVSSAIHAYPDFLTENDSVNTLLQEIKDNRRCEESFELSDIKKAVSSNPDAKKALFWDQVNRVANEKKRIPTRYFSILDPYRLWDVGESDLVWLVQECIEQTDILKKLIVFDTILSIPVVEEMKPEKQEMLRILTDNDEALRKRLARSNRFLEDPLSSHKKWERRDRLREEKKHAIIEKNKTILLSKKSSIEDGTNIEALWFLRSKCNDSSSNYHSIDLEKIRTLYGEEVLEAFLQGLDSLIGTTDVPVHDTESPTNSTDGKIILVLIAFQVRNGDRKVNSEAEALVASRAAMWELNEFPPVLDEVLDHYPEILRSVLDSEIKVDLQKDEDSAFVLNKVLRSGERIIHMVSQIILDHLPGNGIISVSKLGTVIDIVLRQDERQLSAEQLVELCEANKGKYDVFSIWIAYFLHLNFSQAFDYFRAKIEELAGDERPKIVEALFNRLYESSEFNKSPRPAWVKDVGALKKLILIGFEYVDPKNDLNHTATYSPGSRDHAQSLRNSLPNMLAAIGTEEAVTAITAIAAEPVMSDYKDWLLEIRQTALDFSLPPMAIESAIAWADRFSGRITCIKDLFELTLRNLEDIQDKVENGDFSSQPILTKTILDEHAYQLWLGSELDVRSRGRYRTTREEEVKDKKRPDIRVAVPQHPPVSIEIKIYEQWTFKNLKEGISKQLIQLYMKTVDSDHGIFIVVERGEKKNGRLVRKNKRVHNKNVGFDQVLDALQKYMNNPTITNGKAIRIVGISMCKGTGPV